MTRLMKSLFVLSAGLLAWTVIAAATAAPAAAPVAESVRVARIDLDGPIGPAAAEYFDQAVRRAQADGAVAIVLRMDTPGGLADSMRQIITRILASDIPVIGYVAPDGARAASAGTYILYASQLAAMAPATHLGAATPIALGDPTPMPADKPAGPLKSDRAAEPADAPESSAAPEGTAEKQKVLNDAIAYIRSLAQLRGRNAEWAEAAVREAATLTAHEALEKRVIDFIASDIDDLLAQADGREVQVGTRTLTLQLAKASVHAYEPDGRTRFLAIITNPTLAYLLLLAGIYGLVLEALHPGALLPGVVGGISLLVGLYALQLLPVNYAGLALMALGVGMLIAEAVTPSIGALGIGGLVSFVVGSILLFDSDVPGYQVNLGVIAGIAVAAGALLGLILYLVLRSRRTPKFGGGDQLRDARGELLDDLEAGQEAWAKVLGERWRVRSESTLPAHSRVRVTRREGLTLWVEAD